MNRTIPRLSLPVALLLSLGIVIAIAAFMFWMGRLPICKCGYIKLWHGGRGDSEDLPAPRRLVHLQPRPARRDLLLSAVARLPRPPVRGARLVLATLIEGAWEIFENTPFIINRYRTQTISRDYFGDTIINSVGDILAMIVGFLIASRLPAWVTVFLLIATELVLLYLIRDNLLLNIIMLVYPLEWIKQWQSGG